VVILVFRIEERIKYHKELDDELQIRKNVFEKKTERSQKKLEGLLSRTSII
jgi:hypothetical protein